MKSSVENFCQRVMDHFLHGDLDQASTIYAHPLAVFNERGIELEQDEKDTQQALFAVRATALRAGVTQARAEVHSIGKSRAGRFPVRVSHHYLRADGSCVGTSELTYFIGEHPSHGFRIELIEVHSRAWSTPFETWKALATAH